LPPLGLFGVGVSSDSPHATPSVTTDNRLPQKKRDPTMREV